jgi:hypothetical protein
MNPKVFTLMALLAGLAAWTTPAARGDLTIAAGGASNYSIVLPQKASNSTKKAADELQKDIQLAGGPKLAIVTEGGNVGTHYISLGETTQAKSAGFSTDTMPLEGWRIATKGENLYILGPDTPDGGWTENNGTSTGTANGVYTFLEDELGVRWLMPGDLGRDVPEHKTLTIKQMDRSGAPIFHFRYTNHLWDYANNKQVAAIAAWKDHQRVGNDAYSARPEDDANWWRTMNRSADPNPLASGATDPNTPAVRALYEKHPDWFAMNARGERPMPKSSYDKLETTNPELIKWFAQQGIRYLKASKRPLMFSLSPSDGSGYSQSPESKALYDPSPSTIFDREAPAGKPSMSSLILTWYDQIARIVAKEYPQGRLGGYFYAAYLYPPVKAKMKLPDNFTPMIAPSMTYGYRLYRKDVQQQFEYVMNAWAKVIPKNWYSYSLPNQLLRQYEPEIGKANFPGSTGIVTPGAPQILNLYFHTMVKNHVDGNYLYGVPSWSNRAMGNYLLARMQWNPNQDAREIEKDWLNRAYGNEAGATMLEFYRNLDGWFRDYFQKNPDEPYVLTRAKLRGIYAVNYPQMEKLYLAAQSQSMTDVQKQRLTLIGDNLIVLQWRLRNADFWPAGQSSQLQRTDVQVTTLLATENASFPLFPGLVPGGNYPRPLPPRWEVRLAGAAGADQARPAAGMDPNMFLIYAPADTTVRIIPTRVSHGAYFAAYLVRDAAGKNVTWGVLNKGTPIEWHAKANTPYYLYIPPRKPVNYDLAVQNATLAQGQLAGKTLTLSGSSSPLYVFYTPRDAPIGLFADSGTVNIIKPYSGAAAKTYLSQSDYYTDIKVAAALDTGWKFHPDPQDNLLATGVTALNFDDNSWKTLTALDWWQMQGFKDYHGVAWYRIKFNLDQAPPPDHRRARL